MLISYGKPRYGPFRGIGLNKVWLEKCGIEDSWQLADFILGGAGIESVEFALIGINEPGVRLNVACPRIEGHKETNNLHDLFTRLECFLDEINSGLDYDKVLKRINLTEKVSLQPLYRVTVSN